MGASLPSIIMWRLLGGIVDQGFWRSLVVVVQIVQVNFELLGLILPHYSYSCVICLVLM